ncbi:MAG: hypothetical protein KGI59_00875 [Patescibacteria group bacterium]|nr:hypothetical protein [Patescibacteria group bacterium]
MKKLSLILIGVAVLVMLAIHFGSRGGNAQEQTAVQTNEAAGPEMASNTTTNLHFDNLHANPQVQ